MTKLCAAYFVIIVLIVPVSAGAQSDPPSFHLTQQIGRGHIQSLEWHPIDDIILVSTIRGAWFYDGLLREVGHIEDARLATFSPDGELVAGVDTNNQITLWDGHTYEPIGTLPGLETVVTTIAWSPSGEQIATGDRQGTVTVWGIREKREVSRWRVSEMVSVLRWSLDSAMLAVATMDTTLYVFDAAQARCVFQVSPTTYCDNDFSVDVAWIDASTVARSVYGFDCSMAEQWDVETEKMLSEEWPQVNIAHEIPLAYSPDRTMMAQGNVGTVEILDLATGNRIRIFDEPLWYMVRLFWNLEGTQLIGIGAYGEMYLWEVGTGNLLAKNVEHAQPEPHPASLMYLDKPNIAGLPSWSSNSRLLAIPDRVTSVSVWDSTTQQRVAILEDHGVPVIKTAWLSDTDWLTTMVECYSYDEDYAIRIWVASSGQLIGEYTQQGCAKGVAWRPNDAVLVSINEMPADLYVWDASDRKLVEHAEISPVTNTPFPQPLNLIGMNWSPDGAHIALDYFVDSAEQTRVFSYPEMTPASCISDCIFTNHGHRPTHSSAYWSGDGTQWFTVTWFVNMSRPIEGDPFRVEVSVPFNTQSDELHAVTLHGHSASIVDMAPDPSGTNLITTSQDNEARLWNVFTGETLLILPNTSQVAWSPDGTLIGGFNIVDRVWQIYDIQNGAVIASLPVASRNAGYLVWSPDSQKIAQIVDGVVFIWEQ